MGCCASSLKLNTHRSMNSSIYIQSSAKRSRSSSSSGCGTSSNFSANACGTPQRSRTRPICDDFAEQPSAEYEPEAELDRSCGYYTYSSSGASTPSKCQLRRTQDMKPCNDNKNDMAISVGNLEWEMYMMQHAQRIMPKTSSPICQRRDATFELNSRSYHKWRNYLQRTPAHMLHNISHIPEAIAGHFSPDDFPAFSDLEEMESAAKRFKIDTEMPAINTLLEHHLTHTISTDL